MLGMLKSEIYKLFNKKSFYICALVLMGLIGLSVWSYEKNYFDRWGISGIEGISLKQMGFTAWSAIMSGIGFEFITVMNSIFTSIFVCYEFSSGMNKNLVIRGKNKFIIYFSKMLVSMLVPIMYTLLSALTLYSISSHVWNAGNWEQSYVNSIVIPMGLFVLVQMAFQSIFVMFGYLFQNSVWVTATNFGLSFGIIPSLIIVGISYILKNWFGFEEHIGNIARNVGKYWLGSVSGVYSYGYPLDEETTKIFPWLVIAYFIIPAIIGSIIFFRREVK